jgi:hypothetical protein
MLHYKVSEIQSNLQKDFAGWPWPSIIKYISTIYNTLNALTHIEH